VVVGVEPLDHLQRGDIDALLLVATAHGEVLVDGVEAFLCVTLRDGLDRGVSLCKVAVKRRGEDIHQSPGSGAGRGRTGQSRCWE
jgi:hypothetical protein